MLGEHMEENSVLVTLLTVQWEFSVYKIIMQPLGSDFFQILEAQGHVQERMHNYTLNLNVHLLQL